LPAIRDGMKQGAKIPVRPKINYCVIWVYDSSAE